MSLLFDNNLFQQVSYYDPAIHLRLKKKAQIYITAAVVDIAYNDEAQQMKKRGNYMQSGVKWYLLYTQVNNCKILCSKSTILLKSDD